MDYLATGVLLALLCLCRTEDRLNFTIYDETPARTFVANISAAANLNQKYSRQQLAMLEYSILTQTPDLGFLEIEQGTGVLRTAVTIDRDSPAVCQQQTYCNINVDIAIQPREYFQIIKVTIKIEDLNDNAPTFVPGYFSRSVYENIAPGTSFALPVAEDVDSPKFGVVRYDLIGSLDKFRLKTVSDSQGSLEVFLVLQEELDREKREFYRAVVAAYDGGVPAKSGTLSIDIIVLDVNDNNPTFEKDTYDVSVPEDKPPNSVILRVTATDPDGGINGQVFYGFNTKTSRAYGNLFSINNSTGEIRITQKLSFHDNQVYSLIVTAKDGSPEAVATSATVNVVVQDVNDHAPEIIVNALTTTGHVEISEGADIGTFVAHIVVTDLDSGQNGKVSCSLRGDSFAVETLFETEYKIVTAKKLDREAVGRYDLVFMCQDLGSPAQTSSAAISVHILDINDNAPVFKKPTYEVTVKERNAVGLMLDQVSATDADEGANGEVEYRVSGNGVNFLSVDPVNGSVTARISFDYEQAHRLEFTILAIDHGVPALTGSATFILNLLDVDDEKPHFLQTDYTMKVLENRPPGTEVDKVMAIDADSDLYNKFTYFMDPSSPDREAFEVDHQTGRIFTKMQLDRELKATYKFVVLAISIDDPGKSDSTKVTVEVLDDNDHAPVFRFPSPSNHTDSVLSSTRLDSKATQIIAEDADSGPNGNIVYSITQGNEDRYFTIDATTGTIYVSKDLSSKAGEKMTLTIQARDNGASVQHSAEAELTLEVITSPANSLMSNRNLAIVISVVVVSVALTVVLVIAIIITRRLDRDKPPPHHVDVTISTTDKTSKQPNSADLSFSNDITLDEEDTPTYQVESENKPKISQAGGVGNTNKPAPYLPADSRPARSASTLPPYTSSKQQSSLQDLYSIPNKPPRSKSNSYSQPRSNQGQGPHHLLQVNTNLPSMQMPYAGGGADKDSDSTGSSAFSSASNTDSGRGSNEDTAVEARPSPTQPDGVILQPPKLPPKQRNAAGNKSHKNPSSFKKPLRPAENSLHSPPLAIVGPSTRDTLLYGASAAAAVASAQNRLHRNPGYQGGHHGNQRQRVEESSDSEPEWSDEDKEYVYYVNASHV